MSAMTFLLNANISNFKRNFGIASQNVNMLKRNISMLERKKINLEKQFKQGAISAQKLNTEIKQTNKLLRKMKFASRFHLSGQESFKKAKDGLVKGLSFGSTLIIPMKIAMDFETSMIQAYAAANLLRKTSSKKELEEINKAKLELKKYTLKTSADSLFSAAQVFKALKIQMNAGQDYKQAMQSNKAILNYATALKINIDKVASIGLSASSQFGIKAENMKTVLQNLYAASKSANTTMSLMGESMKNVGPAANAFGMNVKTTAANLALFANFGTIGAEAGTSFRAILGRLTDKTGKYKKELDKLAIKTTNEKGNLKNFAEIYKEIAIKTSVLNQSDKINFFKTVFGEEHYSKAIGLANQYRKGALEKVISSMENAKGTAEKLEKAIKNTFSGRLKMLVAQSETHFVSLFDALKPATDQFFSHAKELFSYLDDNKEAISKAFPKLASLIALTLAVSGLKFMFSGLYTTLTTVIKSVGYLNSKLKLNSVFMKINNSAISSGKFIRNGFKTAIVATGKAFSFLTKKIGLNTLATQVGTSWAKTYANTLFKVDKITSRTKLGIIIAGVAMLIGLIITYRKAIKNFIVTIAGGVKWLWNKISGFFSFLWDVGSGIAKLFSGLIGNIFSNSDKTISINKNETKTSKQSISISDKNISKIPQSNTITNLANKKNITQNNYNKTIVNVEDTENKQSIINKIRKATKTIYNEQEAVNL